MNDEFHRGTRSPHNPLWKHPMLYSSREVSGAVLVGPRGHTDETQRERPEKASRIMTTPGDPGGSRHRSDTPRTRPRHWPVAACSTRTSWKRSALGKAMSTSPTTW